MHVIPDSESFSPARFVVFPACLVRRPPGVPGSSSAWPGGGGRRCAARRPSAVEGGTAVCAGHERGQGARIRSWPTGRGGTPEAVPGKTHTAPVPLLSPVPRRRRGRRRRRYGCRTGHRSRPYRDPGRVLADRRGSRREPVRRAAHHAHDTASCRRSATEDDVRPAVGVDVTEGDAVRGHGVGVGDERERPCHETVLSPLQQSQTGRRDRPSVVRVHGPLPTTRSVMPSPSRSAAVIGPPKSGRQRLYTAPSLGIRRTVARIPAVPFPGIPAEID